MYALVDCNNFYVSCEQVFRPDLAKKPVIVLSNNDGCIISRSDEAKGLGLKMAEPAFTKKRFLREQDVCMFSSNYTLYGDMSQRVMDTLRSMVPEVEIYSIDEAFLNLGPMKGNMEDLAKSVRDAVGKNTGIPVSIGVAATKTLAKIANKAAKKTAGIFVIGTDSHRDSVIRNTSVGKVWGIGRQYAKLMLKNSVHTAWDFTMLPDEWLRAKMKVIGLRIKEELLGNPCIPLELIISPKKAIATTRAFGKKTNELRYLKEAVATYAVRCAEKLRRQNSFACIITVFIHTDPFNPNEPQYNKSKTMTLPVATNDNQELVHYSVLCLEQIYNRNYNYKKAGVIVDGLERETSFQSDLFDIIKRKERRKLINAVDLLNGKYGRDKIRLAVQGTGEEWKLRQEMLSKRYTTNWKEIMEVNSEQ